MKKKNCIYKLALLLFVLVIQSCSINDEIKIERGPEAVIKNYELTSCQSQESMDIFSSNGGVICCISGSLNAYRKDTLEYSYQSGGISNIEYNWKIISGSMEIISGQDSTTVKIKFGADFNGGKISCSGFEKIYKKTGCGTSFTISDYYRGD